MTSLGVLTSQFTPYFHIDSTSPYDLVAEMSNADDFYCGTYECVENEGGGDSATATVAIASTPNCVVDKNSATADERVTYTCSVTEVCGTINISLTIENDGDTMTDSNTVTWTVVAGDIANSSVTCMSVQCPSVTIRHGSTPQSADLPGWAIPVIIAGCVGFLIVLVLSITLVMWMMKERREENNNNRRTRSNRPTRPRRTVVPRRVDRVRGSNTRNDCSDCGSVNSAAVWSAREEPAPYQHHHQRGVGGHPHHTQQPGRDSHHYPSSYLG